MEKFIKHKAPLMCLAALLCLAMLAGCAPGPAGTPSQTPSAENSAAPTQSNSAAPSGGTMTISDVKGEVEIPANPQRVVDLSGSSDILHILGYSVVGTANSDAYDYTKFPTFLEDVLAGATILGYSYQDTMDVENILALEPDLIIISTIQEKMYSQLSQVAPTVMIELAQINWQDDLMAMAKIFDKVDAAQAWLNDYLAKAAKLGEHIRAEYGEDSSYLSFLASGGQLFIFDAAGMGSMFYSDMGLAKPEGMPQQENVSLPVVTYEGLSAIDADYIFVLATDADMAALKESAIWNSLPAVQNGNIIELPASPYFNQVYSPIGRLLFLDEVAGLIGQTAK